MESSWRESDKVTSRLAIRSLGYHGPDSLLLPPVFRTQNPVRFTPGKGRAKRGPIVIDFWATWCKPCLRSLPHLEALRKKYEGQQLLVVAISIDESRTQSKVKSYV